MSNTAIIFDLDGTIVLTEEYHFKGFRAAFKDYGIKYTKKMHKDIYTGTGSVNIFETEFKKTGISNSEINKAMEKKQQVYRALLEKEGIPLVKSVERFLQKCHEKGLILGVATSTGPKNANLLLTETELLPYFEVVITIADIINAKPSPDIFLYTAGRLRAQPRETVVIEDSPRGIESAERGGFATVGLTTTTTKARLEKKGADMIRKNYSKLALNSVITLKNSRHEL